jgi:hypothetical protein
MEAQWEKIGPKRGGKPAVQTPNAIGPCLLAGASASEHWDWSALPALLPEPCITHLPSLSAALLGECVIFLAPPTSQGPYFKTVPPLQFNAVVHNGPFPGILTLPGLWGPQKRKKDPWSDPSCIVHVFKTLTLMLQGVMSSVNQTRLLEEQYSFLTTDPSLQRLGINSLSHIVYQYIIWRTRKKTEQYN